MTSRYWPECTCAKEQAGDFEYMVLSLAASTLLNAVIGRDAVGLCTSSEEYVGITMIATLIAGMACEPTGSNPGVMEPERLESILGTLVADVRLRIAEIEAVKEQQGGRTQ
jgi:hypothetical protein